MWDIYERFECYGLLDNVYKQCLYDTMMSSELLFDGLHHSCHVRFIDLWQHIRVVIL